MKYRKIIGVIATVMLLAGLAVMPVLAQPAICSFAGDVTLDGATCVGSTVEARVGTTVVGTTTVAAMVIDTVSHPSYYIMIIGQDTGVPAEDDALNFYVDGNLATTTGDMPTWEQGGMKTLNLAASTEEEVEGEDNPPSATGFASILDKLEIAYGYKSGEGAGGWTVYNPDWAAYPGLNTLSTLYKGRGYWIKVSEACTLTYGDNSYQLDVGWNLIGWLGL